MLAKRQLYLTNNYPLCSFVNDDLSEDEQSLFIQHCYLVTNNLIYLHFNTFKKVSSLIQYLWLILAEVNIRNFIILDFCRSENINVKDVHTKIITLMPCDCVAKSWFLNYCLMQTYDKNGYLSRIQQVERWSFKRRHRHKRDSYQIFKIIILRYFGHHWTESWTVSKVLNNDKPLMKMMLPLKAIRSILVARQNVRTWTILFYCLIMKYPRAFGSTMHKVIPLNQQTI